MDIGFEYDSQLLHFFFFFALNLAHFTLGSVFEESFFGAQAGQSFATDYLDYIVRLRSRVETINGSWH